MKVVYITPGSGGTFYCQNCLRDNALIKSLRNSECDILTMPMYLPPMEKSESEQTPLFFGAVNLYLNHKFPFLARIPDFFTKVFNSSMVLSFAAGRSGSTDPEELGDLTLAMLACRGAGQENDRKKMIDWLISDGGADVFHLSNCLLTGLAEPLKEEFDATIVCSLQDEHLWLNAMKKPFAEKAWEQIRKNSRFVDCFLPVSESYSDYMQERLDLPAEMFRTVFPGVETECWKPPASAPSPKAIGFLSKICPELGFEKVVDAFIILRRNPHFSNLHLMACGGVTPGNKYFFKTMKRRLAAHDLLDDFTFFDSLEVEERVRFFHSITVLSVPADDGEAFGLYHLEANACGVPTVQPDVGAFAEVAQRTGGGVVYSDNNSKSLASELAPLLSDPDKLKLLAKTGRNNVLKKFNIDKTADELMKIYKDLTS